MSLPRQHSLKAMEPNLEPRSVRLWIPRSNSFTALEEIIIELLFFTSRSWYLIGSPLFYVKQHSQVRSWVGAEVKGIPSCSPCLIRGHSCQPTSQFVTSVSCMPYSVSSTCPHFLKEGAVYLVNCTDRDWPHSGHGPSPRSSSSWAHSGLLEHLAEREGLVRWASYNSKHYCWLPNPEVGVRL